MDSLFCQGLDDLEVVGDKRKINNFGKGYRLERLVAHCKSAHKNDVIDDGNMTLRESGFSRGVTAASESSVASAAGLYYIRASLASRPSTTQALAFGPAIATHLGTAEWGRDLDGRQFWRLF
jgi:hypothetical protein